jgi:phosphatidylinositol alpha-1,6-mannosyltransferase
VANSRHTASLLVGLGNPNGKVHVVLPGVDAERFRPEARRNDLRNRLVREGELMLLTVGRLQLRKGHDLVLKTLAAIDRHLHPLRYVVVGDGTEAVRLQELASALGVADVVTFVRNVQPNDLPAYYATADIFVHPNRVEDGDFEGFGLVFLEAAASGLVAIGGASGGTPEAVADGDTGLLVSGTDVEEMRRALLTLILSPSLRARMGAAARLRVSRDFTWERAAQQVREIDTDVRSRF